MVEEITVENLILGFGAVGAIASLKMPGSVVLTKDLFRDDYQMGPMYLYDSQPVRDFCDEIDIVWQVKDIRYGWVKDKQIVEPTRKIMDAYHRRVRGIPATKDWIQSHKGGQFGIVDIHFPEMFWQAKRTASEIIKDEAISIELDNHTVKTKQGKTIHFENLVSTIPMPIFNSLAGLYSFSQQWVPIWIKRFNGTDSKSVCGLNIFDTEYDYINITDSGTVGMLTYRVTKQHEAFDAEYLWEPLGARCLPFGKIVAGLGPAETKDVMFLGRWAEWRDDAKLHTIVEKLSDANV